MNQQFPPKKAFFVSVWLAVHLRFNHCFTSVQYMTDGLSFHLLNMQSSDVPYEMSQNRNGCVFPSTEAALFAEGSATPCKQLLLI